MKPLKPIDYRLLFELLKDSNRSDLQLSKALGVSQPTAGRRRKALEKRAIDGYTIVPKLGKIGFELAALTFMKGKLECKNTEEKSETIKTMQEWFRKQPNVILVQEGRGMGWDSICISLHTSYSEYSRFARALESDLSSLLAESNSLLIDLSAEAEVKPFSLKYLAGMKPKTQKANP